ncbi:MAG: hypothetical protein GY765_18795 [bacterium]|nr:hypothetical protein [bacterium]
MKRKMKNTTHIRYRNRLLTGLCLLLVSFVVQARYKPFYTYYNFSYGAKALGMSNAFSAMADDLSAVFWNPAGVAEFKTPQAYVSLKSDNMDYNFVSQQNTVDSVTSTYTNAFESSFKAVNFASLSVPAHFWDMKWSFALSYYRMVPYTVKGTSVESLVTDGDSPLTETTTVNFSGQNGIDVLGFTAAYHLSDYFALGVTMQQFIGSGTVDYNTVTSSADYTRSYTEKFKGRNYIFGFTFKPLKDVVLAVTYRTKLRNKLVSETTDDQTGTAVTASTEADLLLPGRLSFGLLVKPLKYWHVELDYAIIYYGLGTLTNYYGNTSELEFPIRDDYTFSQKDAVNFRLGTQVEIPTERIKFFLRAGVYSEIPLFVDSADSAVKIKGYSFGVGVTYMDYLKIDIGYMTQKGTWPEAGYFDSTTTVSTEFKNNIVGVSIGFLFGRKAD